MKTYTEEELKLAIEYACGMQKLKDYHVCGNFILSPKMNIQECFDHMNKALYYLSSADNISRDIALSEINEYIKSKK